jgi:phosphatidylglycerol---prolipoprotein diacylglyceryl transferase
VRQTLFIIPHEFLGIPVFGFGWVLMFWGAGSVIALLWQWRRHGWNADTQSLLFFVAAVGAVIAFALPMVEAAQDGLLAGAGGEAEAPRGLPIRGYGVMLLLAVASGVGLAAWRARRMGMDPDLIYSLAFWMFLFGILGARLFFVIEYWDDFQRDTLSATLLAIVNVTQGGLVVYGSVIGGLAAGAVFIRRRGLPLWATADLIAPSMVLGLALGRFGCFLNGCCFGGVCDLPWAVQFPEKSPPYHRQLQTGQLHGLRIAANEKGEPAAVQVDRDSAAALAGLKEGDVIRSIQLPPGDAVRAAAMTRAFAGRPIELKLARGGDIRLTIPTESDGDPQDRLGMRVFQAPGGPAVVSQVTVGGPADRAGIQTGDRLHEVRLPPTPTAAVAQSVMQWSGPQVTLVTERGPIGWVQESVPERSLPVHPTQLYSVINALLLFFFLWVYYPFRTRDGEVFAVLLTIYPITRFLLEAIRIDEPSQFGTGLSISQLVSLAVLVAAAGLWIYLFRRPAGSVLPLHAGAAFPGAAAAQKVPGAYTGQAGKF